MSLNPIYLPGPGDFSPPADVDNLEPCPGCEGVNADDCAMCEGAKFHFRGEPMSPYEFEQFLIDLEAEAHQ